jgi:acyl-coenzyme A synthetase/AMP-(fatty) acid ligase
LTGHSWWGAPLLDADTDAPWLICAATESRAVLRADVAALGDRLHADGVGAGSTVMVRMVPSVTFLKVVLALWSRSAEVVLVDHRTTPAEFRGFIDLLEPQFLVCTDRSDGPVTGIRDEVPFTVERRPFGAPASSDVCLVQFSSGSTGRPKVIGRNAASVLAEIDRHTGLEGFLRPGERVLVLNSIVHTMGLVTGVLSALRTGATVVLPGNHRPAEVLYRAKAAQVNAIFGVPAHFELLTAVRSAPELPSLRLAVCGGERLPVAVYDEFRARFGIPISQVYGVTETGLVAGCLDGPRPPRVGRLVRGAEGKIVDDELYLRLPVSPYLLDDQPDRYVDGWLRTFDRFGMDGETDELTILGRLDSLVTIGGLKVDLVEVESALMAHPSVSEAVVTFGDVIEAYVAGQAPMPSPTELTQWCRTLLSPVKVPKQFFLAPSLPRNRTGKLLRNRDLIRGEMTTPTQGGTR